MKNYLPGKLQYDCLVKSHGIVDRSRARPVLDFDDGSHSTES